jgi:hypothetical protein
VCVRERERERNKRLVFYDSRKSYAKGGKERDILAKKQRNITNGETHTEGGREACKQEERDREREETERGNTTVFL